MSWDGALTFLGKLGAAAGGLTLVGGFFLFMLNNEAIKEYLKDAVDNPEMIIQITALGSRVDETKEEIKSLSNSVENLTKALGDIQTIGELSKEPVIKFLQGGKITDGKLGGIVSFTMKSVKLRECGSAQVRVWFKNGSENVHAFEDVSILDRQGMSIRAPANPGEILERSFTARIPNNEGVSPGVAIGWMEVAYPDCPLVPVEISPAMAFQILDDDGRPVSREHNEDDEKR
jgi:hypothetical protein